MPTRFRYILLCLVLLTGALRAVAQVYTCDFEDAAERGQWVLQTGPQWSRCENKWYIGQDGNHSSSGSNGLFVSADGKTADYTANRTMFVVTYRELTLPAGNYVISFDWNMGGNVDDSLYVCWVPSTQSTNSAAQASTVPAYITGNRIGSMNRSSAWRVQTLPFTSDGTAHKLLFAWFSRRGTPAQPAARVDNIAIYKAERTGGCKPPTNIRHQTDEDGNLVLRWNGSAQAYEVTYYDQTKDQWQEFKDIRTDSLVIKDWSAGLPFITVRSVCGPQDKSYPVGYYEFIYPDFGDACIRYWDLDAATCYMVSRRETRYGWSLPDTIYGKIDYGYDRLASHHTVHYNSNEYDPRTNYGLKTVPDGEFCSVRLGNFQDELPSWTVGDSTDVVEYRYTVPKGAGEILKIKYAMILEEGGPNAEYGGHTADHIPHFALDVLDANRQPLNADGCTSVFFSPLYGVKDGIWHNYTSYFRSNQSDIWWMDWNEYALTLRDYEGQTIIIRFETTDCGWGGHGSYCYFTIHCESGELQGLNCAAPSTHFEAPEGFRYRWYRAADPSTVLSTERTFDNLGPTDTVLYRCDVISKSYDRNNSECFYTLEASSLPRYPVPQITWEMQPGCTNLCDFTNSSYVLAVNQVSGDTVITTTAVDSVFWDFGDGTTGVFDNSTLVTHEYPLWGGTYTVAVTAVLGYCSETREYKVEIPDLTTRRGQLDVRICRGETYQFGGKTYDTDCTDSLLTRSLLTGCDSICYLRLTVHDTTVTQLRDTVCLSTPYVFCGDTLLQSGNYRGELKDLTGCDSLVLLNLTVIEWKDALKIEAVPDACYGDATITLHATASDLSDSIYLSLSDTVGTWRSQVVNGGGLTALSVPLGDRPPGVYRLKVSVLNRECGFYGEEVGLTIRYPVSVMQQKWHDVIGVKNADYNGGFDFVAFQWYLDGQELPGETHSYLYVHDTLRMGHEYTVLLTERNGRRMLSCPIIPVPHTDITAYPTFMSRGAAALHVLTPAPARAEIYSPLGTPVSSAPLQAGDNTLPVSLPAGTYLLRITPATSGQAKVIPIVVR